MEMNNNQSLESRIDQAMRNQGIHLWGAQNLQVPLTIESYQQWLQNSFHGEMAYLETHLPMKQNPRAHWPDLNTAIVVAVPYLPHPKPISSLPKALKVARYAQGEDYHFWLKEKLNNVALSLAEAFPLEKFLVFTDSGPILERDLAQRAGLGWFGKNTCLINKTQGSYLLLGEILTSATIVLPATSSPDFCGKCTACIDACPTQAIVTPRLLDARKCISYLTIESKSVPPVELRKPIGDHFFGCDICQDVCPWNRKPLNQLLTESNQDKNPSSQDTLVQELREILTLSGKKLQKKFMGTPLMRAGSFGLRRNALVLMGNRKLKELKPEAERYLNDSRLGELATWAIEQLNL